MKLHKYKKTIQGFLVGVVVGGLFLSRTGIAAKLNLNSIKPVAAQPVLTDEQQAIAVVRNAKASIVDIVGSNASSTDDASADSLNVISGTGFVIESDGLIVSNNHVVEDPTFTYNVVTSDGTTYPAKVLGQDKYNDVALLKIEAQGLPVLNLGNSDALETGQTVFAIGNSLGKYQNSVTKGVVSGLGRSINVDDPLNPSPRLQNLIQTDAAISPGNSGGPLINLAGEVIGMNTLIDTQGTSLGFAVPVNTIKDSVNQLKNFGNVSKAYVGINFSTINPIIKINKKLTESDGAYIVSVTPGGPAANAGILSGDIIKEINHEKLTQTNEIDHVISKYPAGTQILVTLARNGKVMDVPLILGVFK